MTDAFPDATALLEGLGAGQLHSVGLVEDALARIAAADADIRAFITVDAEGARAAALASDARRVSGKAGPLEGLPFAVKDNIAAEGLPLTDGTAFYRDRIAAADAESVRRMKAAGAVLSGKLNLHEGALGATTDNPVWGRCQNPLRPGYTPGGSSGGSAAAIAAGFVPVSLGTDTMGSVRIPAAYCGLWGLKPTRGAMSRHGLSHLSWTLDTVGPLARSARDLRLLTTVLAGPDPRDPESIDLPLRQQGPEVPSICVFRPAEGTCASDVLKAFDALLRALESNGVPLRPVALPDWDPGRLRRAGLLVSEAEGAHAFSEALAAPGPGLSEQFRSLLTYGQTLPAARLVAALAALRATRPMLLQAMAGSDALLMPTAPQTAFAHGTPVPANQADLTALANAAGVPAVAFPLPFASGELPSSAQLVGRPGDDLLLASWADQLVLRGDATHSGKSVASGSSSARD